MSVTVAQTDRAVLDHHETLLVSAVRNPRSCGIARYATRLAEALAEHDVSYQLRKRASLDARAHFHLANSSRAFLLQGTTRRTPFVVTVHDVIPRTRALLPLYRALAYPRLNGTDVAVIVHTRFAADMLVREARRHPIRLELIPHPARQPQHADRAGARRALGWPEDALIAVVPGVIKSAKLVGEALGAASRVPGWRLALAGRLVDRGVARAAREQGALVLPRPNDADYERAIVASDCVLCVRAGSVGETNGPLLDALGAGRAVLATRAGSIPEVAADAAHYCDGAEPAIAAGLAELSDPSVRAELEAAAARRATAFTWEASAEAHAALFREVFDG